MTGLPHKWMILALVLAAECMDLLDATIVNVAAPTIHDELHAGPAALQWTIGGYALAFAMGLVLGARLGDVFGRRATFVTGALGFVLASLACGLAVDPGMLIGCRLAQGAAAALLIPQGLGIVRDAFPPVELGSAFALFGPCIGLSAVLGPILGGVLIDADIWGTGWRLIFFVNLPVGLAAALGAAVLLPRAERTRAVRLDVPGAAIGAIGMGLLVYPLIQGQEAGWPAWTYLMLGGSAVAFAALVAWLRHVRRAGRAPLIEASIFARRQFSAGLAAILVFFAVMAGLLLVLTLFVQFGAHYSAVHAGITMAPFAGGSALGATLAATVLTRRLGRATLQVAAGVEAAGLWWLYLTVGHAGLALTTAAVVGPGLLLGAGMGMFIAPLFDYILAAVADDEVGSASGVLNATQQLAGALGVAGIGTLFFATLTRSGYVAAIEHCLFAALLAMPVLGALVVLLPGRAREDAAPARPVPAVEAPVPVAAGAA